MDLYLTEELFRQMYFSKTKELQVYIYLMANCNEEGLWEGSVTGLANSVNITRQSARTSLEKLVNLGLVSSITSNQQVTNVILENQYVTVCSNQRVTNGQKTVTNEQPTSNQRIACKSDSYEPKQPTSNQRVTNGQSQSPESLTRNVDVDNININVDDNNLTLTEEKENTAKEKAKKPKSDIEKRKLAFGKTLIPYVDKYGAEMIRDFFDYWSEFNRSKTKMLMETKDTWELPKRLATWHRKQQEKSFRYGKQEGNGKDPRRGAEITATKPEDYDEDF